MYCTVTDLVIASDANYCDRVSFVFAQELTEGDIVRHFTGDVWQVMNEPEYTNAGIVFDVMWLDVLSSDNVQTVNFDPQWRFELIDYKSKAMKSRLVA